MNKKSQAKLGGNAKIGDGVFNLSQQEYNSLNPNYAEKELIQPFYTTKQINRYMANRQNTSWVIYTDSKFKNPENIQPYPNIKNHLDKYQSIITSANKPYGLHRSRDKEVFLGEKILSIRKCSRPSFAYVNFDAYVNRTFNIIRTDRLNLRYLSAILNSRLVAYWLLRRGKLQGEQYQVDVNPIRSIPIAVADDQEQLVSLASKISELNLELSKHDNRFQQLLKSELGLSKRSAKLNNWWTLDFTEFVLSLGTNLSLVQKDELGQLYDKYRSELVDIDAEIKKVDNEIDKHIYKLYELNKEEIDSIERHTK